MRRDGIPLASCSSKGVVDKSYSLKLNFKTDESTLRCMRKEGEDTLREFSYDLIDSQESSLV